MAALTDRSAGTAPTTVAKVPHPVFVLSYEQKNITSDITPYVRSVTYTDYLSGQSDELEVELEDADGRWARHWYPGKGDTLTLKIGYEAANGYRWADHAEVRFRITTNGAMILAGFRFFANTVEKYFPGVFSAKLESLESALLDPTKWMRDTPSEVVRLLNFLSQASHDPEFSRTRAFKDIHYWFEPGESAHGTVNYLCIPCDAVYILYRERMKAIGEEPVFSSAQEMFVALRNSVLVVDSFNHPDRGNNCVKLDPHQLELSQVRPFRPH